MAPDPRKEIHPAQFSDELIGPIAWLLMEAGVELGGVLLDPMAGVGVKLGLIAEKLGMMPAGFEVELAYFHPVRYTAPWVTLRDSTHPFGRLFVGETAAWVCSPPYPNGMSDDFVAKDASRRNTYAHRIRRSLPGYSMHENNSGAMSPRRSEKAYRRFMAVHAKVWENTFEVLKPGAPGVVNVKNTVYGRHVFVEETVDQLLAAGFEVLKRVQVPCRGNRHGANRDARVDHEELILVRKPEVA